jgi:N-dimethylarginine dimethylaminohydrolase
MAAHREKMNTMVIDIALIKERQTNQAAQSLVIEELRSRIEILESRRHQQDGAASFARWLKDFGPWVLAGAAALWTYVKSLSP